MPPRLPKGWANAAKRRRWIGKETGQAPSWGQVRRRHSWPSQIDPASRRELAEILTTLPITLLMVTHDLPCAAQLCSRSVILDEGSIVADRATRELLTDPSTLARHRLELPFGFDPLASGAAMH